MKRLKKFFLLFMVATLATVLTFGTFSVASAATIIFDDNTSWVQFYKPVGPTENHTNYVVFEFSESYKVVYLNNSYVSGLANYGMKPYFNYSSLIGTLHTLSLANILSYTAYVYDVPKTFLDSGGLFDKFTMLNHYILKCDWDHEEVTSTVTSALQLTYGYSGPELSYDSSLNFFSWNFPPVVAGNFSLTFPSAFIVNGKKDSTINGEQLYDVFRAQAAYEGGFYSYDSEIPYQNGYNAGYGEGYDKGYDDGVNVSNSGVFGSASVLDFSFQSAPYTLSEDLLTLDFLRYGLSVNTISANALNVLESNSWTGSKEFTLAISFSLPFTFYQDMIFVKSLTGFSTLTFYNSFGNAYQISVSDQFNEQRGYPLIGTSEDVYGRNISKLVVTMEAGSTLSFSSPFSAVYESGYVEGNNVGLETGYKNGYEIGWSDGWYEGKQFSYDEYAAESTGWSVISGAFSSILSVMDINVFGYFSLGDVVGLVLVFGVVFFVFKLIRG